MSIIEQDAVSPFPATPSQARSCPACGAVGGGRVIGAFPVTSQGSFSHQNFGLVECDCSLIYISPAPTRGDLKRLYEDTPQFDSAAYVDTEREAASVQYVRQRLEFMIARYSIARRPIRVLDVGAGLAWMARAAKEAGIDSVTVAQDVSDECRNHCPWVDHYLVGELEDVAVADHGPYDIISLTHVLEHILDPTDFLGRLGTLLHPGGAMFVTMPHRPHNWDGTREGWLKYSYHHIPAHVQYFSETSLRNVVERAGLSLAFWDASHEGGEALEAQITHVRAAVLKAELKQRESQAAPHQPAAQSSASAETEELRKRNADLEEKASAAEVERQILNQRIVALEAKLDAERSLRSRLRNLLAD